MVRSTRALPSALRCWGRKGSEAGAWSMVQACLQGVPPSRGHSQVASVWQLGCLMLWGMCPGHGKHGVQGFSVLQLPSPEMACTPGELEQSMPCLRESQLGKTPGNTGKTQPNSERKKAPRQPHASAPSHRRRNRGRESEAHPQTHTQRLGDCPPGTDCGTLSWVSGRLHTKE